MSNYIPTTEEVRNTFSLTALGEVHTVYEAAFDRWLAAHEIWVMTKYDRHVHERAEAHIAQREAEIRADEREKAARRADKMFFWLDPKGYVEDVRITALRHKILDAILHEFSNLPEVPAAVRGGEER